jgi:uncharacterized protein (TIGR02246 family)
MKDDAICALYDGLLDAWNRRSAPDMAALFAENGNVVGFDGSVMNGRTEIESHLAAVFRDHVTARYVGKVREVRFLSPDVVLLRAVSGMVPPGGTDINPAVNTIQTLVASREDGVWHVEMYQNTPAAFHGRPDLSAALTEELRALL